MYLFFLVNFLLGEMLDISASACGFDSVGIWEFQPLNPESAFSRNGKVLDDFAFLFPM